MRDLKHLNWFENLLQEANNKLITQAKQEGNICVAFVCENTPEPLMNLGNAFGIRLHAPNTGSMDIATYYMTSFLCETSRALLERAIEGGFNFADCVIAPDGCTMINRCVENMELLKTMGEGNDKFFHEYMEIPLKADDNGVELLVLQCKNHILKPLSENYGIDVSDAAIRKAVEEHNDVKAAIKFIEEQTGEKWDWNAYFECAKRVNSTTRNRVSWLEVNSTPYPQFVGAVFSLYNDTNYMGNCGRYPAFVEIDKKVMKLVQQGYKNKTMMAPEYRHRCIVWGVQPQYIIDMLYWMIQCWGVVPLTDMPVSYTHLRAHET